MYIWKHKVLWTKPLKLLPIAVRFFSPNFLFCCAILTFSSNFGTKINKSLTSNVLKGSFSFWPPPPGGGVDRTVRVRHTGCALGSRNFVILQTFPLQRPTKIKSRCNAVMSDNTISNYFKLIKTEKSHLITWTSRQKNYKIALEPAMLNHDF